MLYFARSELSSLPPPYRSRAFPFLSPLHSSSNPSSLSSDSSSLPSSRPSSDTYSPPPLSPPSRPSADLHMTFGLSLESLTRIPRRARLSATCSSTSMRTQRSSANAFPFSLLLSITHRTHSPTLQNSCAPIAFSLLPSLCPPVVTCSGKMPSPPPASSDCSSKCRHTSA